MNPLATHGLITWSGAHELGLSPHRLRGAVVRGELLVLQRGVAVPTRVWEASDPRQRHLLQIRAVQYVKGERWHAARRSAAVVHGLPLLGPPPTVPQLLAGKSSPSSRATSRHQRLGALPLADRFLVDGVAVTSLGRTSADLAREESFRGAVVAVDAALRAGMSHEELSRALTSMRSWPGIERARAVAAFVDGCAESPLESISRVRAAVLELPAPELQVEVWLGGRCLGRVDMLWEAQNVIGEADGDLKYMTPADLVREKRRQEGFEDAGFEVVRWGWDDVWRRDGLFEARLRRGFARGERAVIDPAVRLVRTAGLRAA